MLDNITEEPINAIFLKSPNISPNISPSRMSQVSRGSFLSPLDLKKMKMEVTYLIILT